MDGYELPCEYWELKLGPRQEQQLFLMTELFHQTLPLVLFLLFMSPFCFYVIFNNEAYLNSF